MRSATSFCNPTLYRKTVARFWPMWAAWGAFWLFVIPMNLLNRYFDRFDRLGFDMAVDIVTDAARNGHLAHRRDGGAVRHGGVRLPL